MLKSINRNKRAASATLIGALLGSTAISTGAFALDELVVTANRRAQSVIDVPYNISAISGDQIESAQILDAAELLRSLPGIALVDRGIRNSSTVNTISIRGVNVDSSAIGDYAVASVPTVSTYVDDTPVFANVMIQDLERVEVLRGPQGTLYGSGSLGGTVRYITRDPVLNEYEGKVGVSFSNTADSDSLNHAEDFMINLPLGDKAALRVVGAYVSTAGSIDLPLIYQLDGNGIPVAPSGVLSTDAAYTSVEDADGAEQWMTRAQLRIEPTDTIDLTLSYTHQDDDVEGRRQTSLGTDGFGRPYGDDELGSIQREPSNREIDIVSLEANFDLGFATLTSSTSYYDTSGDSVSENTGFYAQNGWLGAFYYNYPRPMASAVRTFEDEAITQELRLVSNGDGPFNYVLGFYYQDQERQATQMSFLRGFKQWWDAAYVGLESVVSSDNDFIFVSDEEYQEFAAFGELSYDITDAITVTGGFRWFDNEADTDIRLELPLFAGLFPPSVSTDTQNDDDFLFKGNISWDISESATLFATVSEGYRRGGTNGVPTAGFFAEDPAFLTYDSDSVINYEIGVKGDLGDHRYSASVYYVDWSDPQLNTATPTWGFFAVQNGESAATTGVELELSGNLTDKLSYGIGYAYVDAELTDDLLTPTGFLLAEDGTTLPGTPEHMLNVAADYTQPLANGVDLVFHVDGYYQSDTRNVIQTGSRQTADIDSFTLWNASATARLENVDISLWVKNIANEDGVTGLFTEAFMGSDPAQNYFGNGSKQLIALPRTFGISVDINF